MRTHTRLGSWILLCGLLASCAEGSFEPTAVRDESPVAMDSSTHHLLSSSDPWFAFYSVSGTATFRNVTDRTLYITEGCDSRAMHLERDNGETVPLDPPLICAVDDPPSSLPRRLTAIAPGDSIFFRFNFSTAVPNSVADATVPAITGAVRLVLDVR